MIIQCDKCSTKFRLDDSRIADRGVKVRCTKCQNVFVVMPPPPPEEAHVEEILGPSQAPETGAGKDLQAFAKKEERPSSRENLRFDFSAPEKKEGEKTEEKPPLEKTAPSASASPASEPGVPPAPQSPKATAAPPAPPAPPPRDEGKESAPPLSFGDVDLSFQIDKSIMETLGIKKKAFKEEPPALKTEIGIKEGDEEIQVTLVEKDKKSGLEGKPLKGALDDLGFDLGVAKPGADEAKKEAVESWKIIEDEAGVRAVKVSAEAAPLQGEDKKKETPTVSAKASPVESSPIESAPLNEAPKADTAAAKAAEKKTAPEKPSTAQKEFSKILTEALKREKAHTLGEAGKAGGLGGLAGLGGAKRAEKGEETRVRAVREVVMARPAEKSGSKAIGIIVAAIIIAGGGWALHYTGVIGAVTRLFVPGEKTSAMRKVEIEALKAYIAENRNFGKVFVIEAMIRNATEEPRKIKGIRGAIYDRRGAKIKEKTVSPGRVAAAEDLKNLTMDELMKPFRDSSGAVIPPKGTIPIMVPFTEVPAEMAEYGIDVIL